MLDPERPATFTCEVRTLLLAALLGLASACGCAHQQAQYGAVPGFSSDSQSAPASPATSSKPPATTPSTRAVLTPATSLRGKVARANPELHFVVLNFPLNQMPQVGARLNVYRAAAVVGEVKVTGPQLDDDIDADVVSGSAQAGDEVRDN